MTPLLLGAAGLVALVAGGMVLRTFGARYRIARLLATVPRVSVAEATELAATGRRAYVRVDGRIDADEPFEDADHRPLVFRRVRLEEQVGRGWRAFEDQRQAITFTVNEGLDAIAIDADALGDGLVVVPRESVGRADDLVDRVPAGTPPDRPVRARIEQISAVEHAIVLGYPVAAKGTGSETASANTGGAARAVMTAGRNRPLILTVLEPPEAMRILAAGGEDRTRAAALLLGAGVVLVGGALLWALVTALLPAVVALLPGLDGLVSTALAVSPEPSAPPGGDPRSSGQGPGLVGTPGLAILGVILIGVVAFAVTFAYVRLTRPPGGPGGPGARTGQPRGG